MDREEPDAGDARDADGGEDLRGELADLREAVDELDAEVDAVDEAVGDLDDELEGIDEAVEERTVHRSEIEAELKRYVRSRLRRGHARGWGPYLVLLYGTVMTLGAFRFLDGGWAILAMVVVWLSTLGLYVLMVLVGAGIGALDIPRRVIEAVRERR